MAKNLICPRTEICYVYRVYVESTKEANLGIIRVSSVENRDYYICKAFTAVEALLEKGELSEEDRARLEGVTGCYLIDQANKSVDKRRPDL